MNPSESLSLIDSHCHLNFLDLSPFNDDLNEVMQQAQQAGVSHLLSVCVEIKDLPALHAIAERFSNVSTSVGCHPNDVGTTILTPEALIQHAQHPSCIAFGETGLDYYRTEAAEEQASQQASFRAHIQAALTAKKPLIIHTRQAAEDTLRVMQEEQAHHIGGVMHCFSEDWDIAKRALDLNFYISFSGIVTFKNALILQEVAKKVPLERILIETDAPYLAPVPHRGQQNHPAFVRYVAIQLATLRGEPLEKIAHQTTENFYQCFRFNASHSRPG